jgi:cytidine kinase
MSVLVVGSIAIDTVKTPVEEQSELLGGSDSSASSGMIFQILNSIFGKRARSIPKACNE